MKQLSMHCLQIITVFSVVISLLIFDAQCILAQAELGRPLITNYSYRDYGGGATSWWALEDRRGLM